MRVQFFSPSMAFRLLELIALVSVSPAGEVKNREITPEVMCSVNVS